VNQSRVGSDTVNAIINCHLLTGRIGRAGMGPFSITGQPNAMGGREVGGLANQLACHMDLENAAHRALVQAFWQAPRMAARPGLKAVELFDAVAAGRIKALWIMATNPVDSLPDADKVRRALEQCDTVVVSDVTAATDTAQCADILLPAAAWGEKDGTVTNSERCISRQRAFQAPPGGARPDWRIICDVAARMGWGAHFAYDGPAAIFREYAALSAYGNADGARAFDIGALAALSDDDYAALEPLRWPLPASGARHARAFADKRFFTPSRRARFIAPAATCAPTAAPAPDDKRAWPYVLNTGRVRDQWHMMTRTGLSPRLSQHLAEPFVEIHPQDALKEGIGHAGLVAIDSPHGEVVVRALITPGQRPGALFVPMHWSDQFASHARIDSLVAAVTDPVSGQPDSKRTRVRVRAFAADWYGFVLTRYKPPRTSLPEGYWALARTRGGWRIEAAGKGTLDEAAAWARLLVQGDSKAGEAGEADAVQSFRDDGARQWRLAAFDGARLRGLAFLAAQPVAVSRQWAAGWLARDAIDAADCRRLLAGRAGRDRPDP
ncbi:MAG: nitrate reductase, partial [Alphaproteobacteria bacterium]